MGKQINYYMEYKSFLIVAQAALEKGFVILRETENKIIKSKDISIITEDCKLYHFYLPEAGELKIETVKTIHGYRDYINKYSRNAVIEAGFSCINENRIISNRLYIQSGYYAEDGTWIPRPDCITKVYNSLVRVVKKIAPYREYTSMNLNHNGLKSTRKEYVTDYCAELNKEGNYMG
jgi:hypothetical protein